MIPALLKHVQSLGYRIFDGGHAYNLNIIGIRNSQNVNSFNDFLCCVYREEEDGPWVVKYWAATTDPGKFCLENHEVYGTEAGTAIVVPGQYRGVYKLDLHRGKYEALCDVSRFYYCLLNRSDKLVERKMCHACSSLKSLKLGRDFLLVHFLFDALTDSRCLLVKTVVSVLLSFLSRFSFFSICSFELLSPRFRRLKPFDLIFRRVDLSGIPALFARGGGQFLFGPGIQRLLGLRLRH